MHKIINTEAYNRFVDDQLTKNRYTIIQLTEEYMRLRLHEFMDFMNKIMKEYEDIYGWKEEKEEYFLNGMVDKWKYSYTVIDEFENICFISLNSRYNDAVHFHSIFAKKELRSLNFTKLMIIKTAGRALENNIRKLQLHCHRKNSKAIILYLKLGFQIQCIKDEINVLLSGDAEKIRDKCYELVVEKEG